MSRAASPPGGGGGGDSEPGGGVPARLRRVFGLMAGDGRRRDKAARLLGVAPGHALLAEGPHLLREARAARAAVLAVVATPAARAGEARADIASFERAGVPVFEVPPAALARLAATRSPQGVVAIVELPQPPALSAFEALWQREAALVVALDGVQDPGNVGSLARTALACGAVGAILGEGCARADDPKALRASQGALFALPALRSAVADAIAAARRAGARVAAALPRGGQPPWHEDLTGPLLLLLGGEGGGLSPAVASAADVHLTLPMAAGESLGVAAAGSALMYERVRQREACP